MVDLIRVPPSGPFVPLPTPPAAGGPLPRTYWVSPLSVGSTQDGSDENPFLTVQAGIDRLETDGVGGTLMLAAGQGLYNAMNAVVTSVDVAFVGNGTRGFNSADRPFLASLTMAGSGAGVRVSCENMGFLALEAAVGSGCTLYLFDCVWLGGLFADCTIRAAYCNGAFGGRPGTGGTVTLADCSNCTVGFVGAFGSPFAAATLRECNGAAGPLDPIGFNVTTLRTSNTPVGNVNADTWYGRTCRTTGQILVATSSDLDTETLAGVRAAGVSIPFVQVLGALTIADRPLTTGLTFTVPALAAAFADVTAALPNAKPGDTFEVTTTTRLADVGIVDAFCAVAGVLTLRFFGTTAGGDVVCNVNLGPNSP